MKLKPSQTDRWNAVLPVANTIKLHCIKSHSRTKISVSITSSVNVFIIEDIFKSDADSETHDFNDKTMTVRNK